MLRIDHTSFHWSLPWLPPVPHCLHCAPRIDGEILLRVAGHTFANFGTSPPLSIHLCGPFCTPTGAGSVPRPPAGSALALLGLHPGHLVSFIVAPRLLARMMRSPCATGQVGRYANHHYVICTRVCKHTCVAYWLARKALHAY